jgi:hypothetical protein
VPAGAVDDALAELARSSRRMAPDPDVLALACELSPHAQLLAVATDNMDCFVAALAAALGGGDLR